MGCLFFEDFFEFLAFFSGHDVAAAVFGATSAGVIEEVAEGKAIVKGDFFTGCNGFTGCNPDLFFVYYGVAIFFTRVIGVLGDVVGVVSVDIESFSYFEGPDM